VAHKTAIRFLSVLLATSTLTGCGSDAWLHESNPSGNLLFDLRLGTEVRSYWYVSGPQIGRAVQLLGAEAIVPVSREQATQLAGRVPDVPPGESLYLVRAIDLGNPRPIRIYRLGAWVQIDARTDSSCFAFPPDIKHQPIVVAFPGMPTRLRLSYSCAG
jgi:hypothetical protein